MGTARDLNDYPGRRTCGTAGFNKQDIYARDCVAFNVEVSGGDTNDQEKQGTVKHPLE